VRRRHPIANYAGVRFIGTSQGIDTDAANPTSRLLLHILAAVIAIETALEYSRASNIVSMASRYVGSPETCLTGAPRMVVTGTPTDPRAPLAGVVGATVCDATMRYVRKSVVGDAAEGGRSRRDAAARTAAHHRC
jgi:hypothetical protein